MSIVINPLAKISDHFTNKEALWLPKWNRMANEDDGLTGAVFDNLKLLFYRMDLVRNYFGLPVVIHCAYRPQAYNQLVGGAKNSPHIEGLAADFHIDGLSCDDAKKKILEYDMLSIWNMRMENGTTDWIHLDCRAPGPSGRYFNP